MLTLGCCLLPPNQNFWLSAWNRAGLNEGQASSKVVTARPPKRLAQLRNASQLVKMSKLIRFGNLHFIDN